MNFFKKVLGFATGDLKSEMAKIKIEGTLFRVIKDTRSILFAKSMINFALQDGIYFIEFTSLDEGKQDEYRFPVHTEMNPVTFQMNKGGKAHACFEWQLEEQTEHVGCYMDPSHKHQFKNVLCMILKELVNDENIKDHLDFCKELAGIPVYKESTETQDSKISATSSKSVDNKELLNDVLIAEAQKSENKMVHTCSYFTIQNKERKLIQANVVFVLKCLNNFRFEFQLVNQTGFTFMKKQLNDQLTYQINTNEGYIRWLNVEQTCKIIEINFDGKRDAALSLKYNIMECMFEMNSKKKIEDQVKQDERAYMRKMTQTAKYSKQSKIIKLYDEKEEIQGVKEEISFIYEDEQVKKGLQKYKTLCQGKIHNINLTALGSMLQLLKISSNDEIKMTEKKRIFDKKSQEIQIEDVLLYDGDSKGFVQGTNGKLYLQDLVKGKLVNQFNPSPTKGILKICPEFKLAQTKNFSTFKAINDNSIFDLDPRTEEGGGSSKFYTTSMGFNTMSVDSKGRFAVGSDNGQIRLYGEVGKNANTKFSATGDPVINLDSTKDGKWLLATFKKYIRLLPTETEDEVNMYDKKIPFNQRPDPVKLQLKLQDLQRYKIDDLTFVPAKFDQSSTSHERYIVSGFGNYTVIWNLNKVLQGETDSYFITKAEGALVQVDFKYNDPSKLIMTTSNGIVIKQNKIKK